MKITHVLHTIHTIGIDNRDKIKETIGESIDANSDYMGTCFDVYIRCMWNGTHNEKPESPSKKLD